mgnify:CR=1 FL=1
MGFLSRLRGKKSTFTGTVARTAPVMTSSSNGTAFFGVRFREQKEWLRVYTNDLALAEDIAFLAPGEAVRIDVRGSFRAEKSQQTWYRLESVAVT